MSQHIVEVVPIHLEPHPNADSLSVVKVRGFTVCARTSDWIGVTQAAYVPPDSVVPDKPEYAFLGGKFRIKVKKLRGVVSMGLLVPAPDGSKIGDNVADRLGITHYDPPEPLTTGGDSSPHPGGYRPNYDVESLRRYNELFIPGEQVIITEKLHGANARYCFAGGVMHCGSRTGWKKEDDKSIWWRALYATPGLIKLCQSRPEITVYGEVYGQIQDLKYGHSGDKVSFGCFDILRGSEWVPGLEARGICDVFGVPVVPLLGVVPYDFEQVVAFAEGQSTVPGANHVREGCVVKPVRERTCTEIGRVQLKVVGNGYLEKS